MSHNRAVALGAILFFHSCTVVAQEENIVTKTLNNTSWSDLLVDTSPGSIAAAEMLSISGDTISNVQNIRDIVVSLKGLSSDDEDATLAISITPARTSLTPMNLSTYHGGGIWARALGNMTLGYAQGDAEVGDSRYERRALSVQTSFFFSKQDDPILSYANALEAAAEKEDVNNDCYLLRMASPMDLPTNQSSTSTGSSEESAAAAVPREAEADWGEEISERADRCRKNLMESLRWNRSNFSLTIATGRLKGSSGPAAGSEGSMGNTYAASIAYGFDNIPHWSKKALLNLIYRKSVNEPVLQGLETGTFTERDTSLIGAKFLYGGEKARFLIEANDTQSSSITSSQRAFKFATGLEIKILEKTWLHLRFGKQRAFNGSENEYGSLLQLSYSPDFIFK